MRKLILITIFCALAFELKVVSGKAVTVHKTEASTTMPSPEEKTAPPWLKFLKSKKTTPHTTETTHLKPSVQRAVEDSNIDNDVKSTNSARAIDAAAPPQSEMDQLAQWLGISVQPSGGILAQDRQQNPNSFYDEMYLDWMKRDLENSVTPPPGPGYNYLPPSDPNFGSSSIGVVDSSVAQPQPLISGYSAIPSLTYGYSYSPFYPFLGGIKLQKAMAKAQVDAAMAALDITTTPKPLKLKLKIQVPGNINMTQLGQITAGLANSLPPGSTYELV